MRPVTRTIDLANPHEYDTSQSTPLVWRMGSRPCERTTSRRSLSRALRVVGLMAFAQSLMFLVFWLLICASAGAKTAKKADFSPDLQLSTFEPSKSRDPFGKVGVSSPEIKSLPGAPIALQLEGILYESSNPSAIVNGRLLTLDKSVTLTAGNGEVKVRAVEITRDHVIVEANGQRIDLRLATQTSAGRQ